MGPSWNSCRSTKNKRKVIFVEKMFQILQLAKITCFQKIDFFAPFRAKFSFSKIFTTKFANIWTIVVMRFDFLRSLNDFWAIL